MEYIIETKLIHKGQLYKQTFKVKKSISLIGPDVFKIYAYVENAMIMGSQWELIDSSEDSDDIRDIIETYLQIDDNDRMRMRKNDDFFRTFYNEVYELKNG